MFVLPIKIIPCYSQFEEKFEEINGVEAAPLVPANLLSNDNTTAMITTEEREKRIEMQEQEGDRIC